MSDRAATHHEELTAYIADNYGRCILSSCRCVRPENPWLGRGCLHWKPTAARNWSELRAQQMAARR